MGRNKVKPEQASKVLMRMPTLRSFGEGRTCGEAIDTCTHAIRRGSGYGTSVGWFVVTGGDPSEPCGEVAPLFEAIASSDRGYHGAGDDRSDAGDAHQPRAPGVLARNSLDLVRQAFDALIKP